FMADGSPDQAEGALTWLAEGPIPASLVQALQRRTSAGSLGEDVYVYFEQGLAPERIDGSIGFSVAPGVRIPKVAVPRLRSRSLASPPVRKATAMASERRASTTTTPAA
ncbi:MAG: hypothetical protein ACO3ZY_11410, partial [Phycisphaerales bacterium]